MPKAAPALTGFNAGLLSPQVGGRIDIEKYRFGCIEVENFIPEVEGHLTKRPGTRLIAPAKYASRAVRMIGFEFSNEQAYELEFGDGYFRVHRNRSTVLNSASARNIATISATNPVVVETTLAHGLVGGEHVFLSDTLVPELNGSFFRVGSVTATTFTINLNGTSLGAQTFPSGTSTAVYEVATTYSENELRKLKRAQSLDVLYLTLPGVGGSFKKVIRSADDSWVISDVWTSSSLEDPDPRALNFSGLGTWPPFAPLNVSTTTVTWPTQSLPGVTITLTSSAPVWVASDVGRYFKVQKSTASAGFCQITAFNSSTSVDAVVKSVLPFNIGSFPYTTRNWGFSLFDDTNGWPRAIGFYEDRLFLAGADAYLQTWAASVSGDFENFRPYSDDGTTSGPAAVVAADSGIVNTVNSDRQNAIEWFLGQDQLFMGTRGGEFTIEGANIEQGIQPNNLFVKKRASYGSRVDVEPIAIENVVLFAQRAGKKVRELVYRGDADKFVAPDMTRLSREILYGKIKYMEYQQDPSRALWCVQEDGTTRTFTYEREEGVTAWSKQRYGGSNVFVHSVSTIPSANDDEDEVWMAIRRTFDGVDETTIELLDGYWDRSNDIEDAIFLDSAVSFENEQKSVTDASGTPYLLEVISHGLFFNDRIEVVTNPLNPELEGKQFTIITFGPDAIVLYDLNGVIVNDPALAPGIGATIRKVTNEISGAIHLAGQTVGCVCGGKVVEDVEVSDVGTIELPVYTGQAHVGHRYEARMRTMRIEAGSANGTAQGKIGRIPRCVIRLDQTGAGLYVGANFDDQPDYVMDFIEWRPANRRMDQPDDLKDGDTGSIPIPGGFRTEKTIALKHTEPLPCSILAIFPEVNTQD